MTTLEKLRAEINDIDEGISSYHNDRPWIFKDEVLQIIDKYAEQESKTGHWIRVKDKTEHWVWECDKCGWQQRFDTNYCPYCGARMVEPQESEE